MACYKRKKIAPTGRKFFPFIVGPFSKGDLCAGKQTGSYIIAFIVTLYGLMNIPEHRYFHSQGMKNENFITFQDHKM